MGVGVSCNFRHIYWHNLLWQMLSHITIRLMLCLNTVADVFATTFGRLFCMIWHILAHICNGRCYCHIWVFMTDVCAIVDNIGKPFGVSKLEDVTALSSSFCGRCYCHCGWWNYHLRCFKCWQMLLPWIQLFVADVIAIVADGINTQGGKISMNVMCGRWNNHCQHIILIGVLRC